jgi:hypothetical protein
MEGSFTDAVVHDWLQVIADNAWISLHYATPALGGIGACEIHGGGYVRAKVAFSQPTNRAIWSLEDARFTGLVQNQLTHFGINNSESGGLLLAYGPLPTKAIIMNGHGYVLRQGELAVSIG